MSRLPEVDAQHSLAYDIEDAIENGASVVLTPPGSQEQVVVLCAEDMGEWNGLLDLLRDPAAAERLIRSIRAAQAGQAAEPEPDHAAPPAQH